MSLPSPSPYSRVPGNIQPRKLSPNEQEAWDAPYIALAQKSNGDLRLLLQSFFSFLHRKTDFYYAHNPEDVQQKINVKMGFKEGDAEKLLLASFRQFPLRRMPKMSDMQKGQQMTQQQQSNQQKDDEVKKAPSKDQRQGHEEEMEDSSKSSQNGTTAEKKDTKETTSSSKANDETEDIRYSKDGKQIPVGNGGTNFDFNFQWTQTIQEVSIALPLPPNTRAKELDVQIKHGFLSVNMNPKPKEGEGTTTTATATRTVLLDGKLKHTIRTDESTWTIEDNVLLVILDKKDKTWWDCVLVMEETDQDSKESNKNLIDTSFIDSTSKISEYDQATQGMIRKIIFDQRQERLGLPKSDDILRKEAVAKMKSGDDDIVPPSPPTNPTGSSSTISMISQDNMPPLPPGVEFIDKTIFPTSNVDDES